MRSAVNCGIARWFDFSPEVQERAGLRKVKIDPIFADLVSQDDAIPIFDSGLPVTFEDPLNVELYDLGDILGLDPEIEEKREDCRQSELLKGAREVDTTNVRTWMIKKRRKVDEQASKTNSECESYFKF